MGDTAGGGGAGGDTGDTGGDGGPCEDGATRTCEIELPAQGNVRNCFKGVQTCAGGAWGACVDSAVKPPAAPEDGPLAGRPGASSPRRGGGRRATASGPRVDAG